MDGEGPGENTPPGPRRTPDHPRNAQGREEPARYGVMSTFNAVRPSIAR